MKRSRKCLLRIKCLVFLLLIFSAYKVKAQQQNIPYNSITSFSVERQLFKLNDFQHTAFKPLLQSRLKNKVDEAEVFYNLSSKRYKGKKPFFHVILNKHLIHIDTNNVSITIDPLVNFEFAQENSDFQREESLYKNMRGFVARVNLGDKVSFETTFRENQVSLPSFQYHRIRLSRSAYGQGLIKITENNSYDFAMASSVVSYSPNANFNIQFGQGKHFIGHGHRSLILSDLAFSYPFLKANVNLFKGRLQYQSMYLILQGLDRVSEKSITESLFTRNQASFHYLDFAVNERLNIGLVEGIAFKSIDTIGRHKVPANHFIPLIGLNYLVEGDEKIGNSFLGLNLSYRLADNGVLYSQIVGGYNKLSSPSAQLGLKYFVHKNLMLQAEYNLKSEADSVSMFNHYRASLNTPAPNNSAELYASAMYKRKRIISQLELNQINSEFDVVNYVSFKQYYILNPVNNFSINFSIQKRVNEFENNLPTNDVMFYTFGLSTSLQNIFINY